MKSWAEKDAAKTPNNPKGYRISGMYGQHVVNMDYMVNYEGFWAARRLLR